MSTVGILLCGGASRRFGVENKLLADLAGRPLVTHAADALLSAGCDALLAVTGDARVAGVLPGFEIVAPGKPQPEQADSLRAGILRARDLGAERALVALGDMPFVPASHLRAVIARGTPDDASATTDGRRRMPPAWFPARLFDDLAGISGDRGAQAVLAALPPAALVHAEAGALVDIDTPGDLAEACRTGAALREVPPR